MIISVAALSHFKSKGINLLNKMVGKGLCPSNEIQISDHCDDPLIPIGPHAYGRGLETIGLGIIEYRFA
jgi:hypothetical protein